MTVADPSLRILPANLDDPRVRSLLEYHTATARAETGRGSAHALDLAGLRQPDIRVWAAWEGEALLGVGALRRLAPDHGEIKSMHVAESSRGRGVGSAIVLRLLAEARAAGLRRVSLETGSWPYFDAARALYRRHGFAECPPFGDYVEDPNSVFMSRDLGGVSDA